MATKKTGLGRGLDALLGPMNPVKSQPDPGQQVAPVSPDGSAQQTRANQPTVPIAGLQTLALELLQPGAYQPRRDMHKETLKELADSIRSQGYIDSIPAISLAVQEQRLGRIKRSMWSKCSTTAL